jgi:hypothetical protein
MTWPYPLQYEFVFFRFRARELCLRGRAMGGTMNLLAWLMSFAFADEH